ncbi:type II secretory pathway component PulK [Idiomarina aquatica]|uniref:Type II secretory pathway component PulK n=1 Tax=Idiomarina aquatica TaxID=1327752 RepID=A0A4R6PPE9_9GAMM|nr:type II secretion system protein GspK [Idiomarina aquatica]TDP40235.1 type II secretory pathway component PulK [Idiomarina aquatica]
MVFSRNKGGTQTGVALIQAIVLSAVLSIILLFLNTSAKKNVEAAQTLQDKNQALVDLYSTEAQLLYDLFTNEHVSGEYAKGRWYFWGKPFNMDETAVVSIQDQAGLLNLHQLAERELIELIERLGYDKAKAAEVAHSLIDWQDSDNDTLPRGAERQAYQFGPRNKPMPELSEINWLPQVPFELRETLQDYVTIFSPGYFNPANAPDKLLAATLDVGKLSDPVKEFRLGRSSTKDFKDVSQLETDEGVYFFTSKHLAYKIAVTVGQSTMAKQMQVVIDPYSDSAQNTLKVLSINWGDKGLINEKLEDNE